MPPGRHAPLRTVLVVAAMLCGARAQAALELSASIQAIESATVATVVLVPPMAVFQQALTPTGLSNNGCHYTTSDRAAIRALVAVLQAADVTANPVYQKADTRVGTYFTLADGSRFNVLVADNNSSRVPAMGVAELTKGAQIQSASFSARPALSKDVRAWAKRYGGSGTGTGCDQQSNIAEDPKAPPPLPR